MDTTELNELIDYLPSGKTHYRYYKGAYLVGAIRFNESFEMLGFDRRLRGQGLT